MINRVQAFNNKNNYKQNFGMAFKFRTAEAKKQADALIRDVSPTVKSAISQELAAITKARAGDTLSTMYIEEATLRGSHELLVKLVDNSGKEIPGTTRLFSKMCANVDSFMTPIREVNAEATALETLPSDVTRAIPVES